MLGGWWGHTGRQSVPQWAKGLFCKHSLKLCLISAHGAAFFLTVLHFFPSCAPLAVLPPPTRDSFSLTTALSCPPAPSPAMQHVLDNLSDLPNSTGAADLDLIFLRGIMESPIVRSLAKVQSHGVAADGTMAESNLLSRLLGSTPAVLPTFLLLQASLLASLSLLFPAKLGSGLASPCLWLGWGSCYQVGLCWASEG